MSDAREELMRLLQAPFEEDEIEWRVSTTIKKETPDEMSLYVPYITNRAIQNRLDEVFGVSGWSNEFKELRDGNKLEGFMCGITARFYDDAIKQTFEITKWDASGVSNIESIKGGVSDSMKRAAVQFGIGRYLYTCDGIWCKTEKIGKKNLEPNKLKLNYQKDAPDDTDEIVRKINSCQTLDEMKQMWTFITKTKRSDKSMERISSAKDRKKAELGAV